MSEWKKVKLGEISQTIQTGPFGSQLHQSDYSVIGIPVVMPKDIIAGNIEEASIARVEQHHIDRLSRHMISYGDILYARRGDVGKCAFTKQNQEGWLCGTGCLRVTINPDMANPKFVFFQLQKQETIGWITNHAIGSTMLNLNTTILSNAPVEIPSLRIQNRIVEILSRYDSLIENYQKQIKLLEEAAQRLYKEWFIDLHFPGHETTKIVDGVPEGWEKKSIGEIGEYLNGFAFKPSDWQDLGKPIIKIKEMGNGVTNETPRNSGERVPAKYLIKAGDLLFSWSATLMVIIWSGEEGWLNQHLFKVTPVKGIDREFLLQSISNTIVEFQNLTTGSTMKHIQRNKLDQVFVNVPNAEIMKRYSDISEKTRSNILSLQSQLRLLTEARDRLLPRLMSGEIEI